MNTVRFITFMYVWMMIKKMVQAEKVMKRRKKILETKLEICALNKTDDNDDLKQSKSSK